MWATSRMPFRTSCQLLWNDSIWVRRRERLVKTPSISLQSFLSEAPMTRGCPRYRLSCGKTWKRQGNWVASLTQRSPFFFQVERTSSEDMTVTLHFLTSPFTFSLVDTFRVNRLRPTSLYFSSWCYFCCQIFFKISFLPLWTHNYLKGLWKSLHFHLFCFVTTFYYAQYIYGTTFILSFCFNLFHHLSSFSPLKMKCKHTFEKAVAWIGTALTK